VTPSGATHATWAWEGVVSKRRDAPYHSDESRHWLKTKCVHRKRFVVFGCLPEGDQNRLGALLLAAEREGELVYVGKVGTGFTAEVARDIWRKLEPMRRQKQPCSGTPSPPTRRKARWVDPTLVAEVDCRGITMDGKLRHPVFRGVAEAL
jgi:bifunctional non-homologous end joining protein LigD